MSLKIYKFLKRKHKAPRNYIGLGPNKMYHVLCGVHMESTWSSWTLHKLLLESTWGLSGVYMEFKWSLYGVQMESMWSPSGVPGVQVEFIRSL